MKKHKDEILQYIRDLVHFKDAKIDWKDYFDPDGFCGIKDRLVLIEGWCLKKDSQKIKNEILKFEGSLVEIIEPDEEAKDTPVALNNPSFLRPFQKLIKMYSTPLYGNIDPTLIFAIGFSLFFGIMFPSFIDGIIISIGSFLVYRWKKDSLFLVGCYLGISSMIFGVLFGEYAGGLFSIPPILFSPLEDQISLLYLSIGIGVAHISLGYLISIINYTKQKNFGEAVGQASFLLLISAVIVFFILKSEMITIILALIGFILMFKNPTSIIEIPRVLANVISYGRLLAISVAHVGITRVFTSVGTSFFASGILGILGGSLFILFDHLLLLTILLLIALVHSLRLNYVEFFSKFYEIGSFWFEPGNVKT